MSSALITKHTPNSPGFLVKTFFLFASCHGSIPTLYSSEAKNARFHNFTVFIPTVKSKIPDCAIVLILLLDIEQ